ncbi:hypothetical protein GGX14DRAFT_644261 [Mycena pura]|uniref:Uncharacterized protein n=1 Tax=Mycena pura TaxID=153505 RepID=A0AAD6V8H9_9AGAR|nr:hypothetical protein GGX14DRAFT_644261 [Mycena pura]
MAIDAVSVSPEAFREIVRNVARRCDIAALCGVCSGFRRAAEPALYNTLAVGDADPRVCATLAGSPRIAALVVAFTVQLQQPQQLRASTSGSESVSSASRGSSISRVASPGYWRAVAAALRNMTRLRHLRIDLADLADGAAARAWVLQGCAFQLQTFHCDFEWDAALCAFLATQEQLHDLYLREYQECPGTATDDDTAALLLASSLAPSLPSLSILECTFSEAAVALAPGRPLSRLKTCFGEPAGAPARDAELRALVGALARRHPATALLALDVGAYDAPGTAEAGAAALLHRVAHTRAVARGLRYLGTLVLPVGGHKRLQFYGLLMRVPRLRCVELDVTAWAPAPAAPAAFRALAAELRLYCPAVHAVVFVHGAYLERTVVNVDGGTGVLKVDNDARPELFWREV